jgi:pimeloyl-ACP methyl ester carboxylesterase
MDVFGLAETPREGSLVTVTAHTAGGIAYDRAGPRGERPVVLIHAGVADRRMWNSLWLMLTAQRDAVRFDLRGFGESVQPPVDELSPVDDLLGLMAELDIDACHLVGASFGAGVAVELALTNPERVASLLLTAPGGSLIAQVTPDLEEFIAAENAALDRGDIDSAADANVDWWVDGPHRDGGAVDAGVRDAVRRMQRRAFELTAGWDDVEEAELDPPALDRLPSLRVPTLVLTGELDLDAIHDAAQRLIENVPTARREHWSDVAHLPSMECPDDFYALLIDWLAELES